MLTQKNTHLRENSKFVKKPTLPGEHSVETFGPCGQIPKQKINQTHVFTVLSSGGVQSRLSETGFYFLESLLDAIVVHPFLAVQFS